MSPAFRGGDLAIVTRSTDYDVGDIAAYRSHLLDTVVLHRIVDRHGDHYVLKGDANSWQDTERPTSNDLIGKLLLRVPAGGRVLGWLAAPWPFTAAAVVISAGIGTSRRKTRRQGQPMKVSASPTRTTAFRRAHAARTVGRGGLIALMAFAAIAAVAFTQPSHRPMRMELPYVQRGWFDYTTPVAPSAAYPDGVIRTGDPLFLRLTPSLDLRFRHRLETGSPHSVEGTITLRARVDDGTGWQRTIDLAPGVPLVDGDGTATATLDITSIRSLVHQLEASTGVRSGVQNVNVLAVVRLHGSVGDRRIDATFEPELPFRLDDLQLRPSWADRENGESSDVLKPAANRYVHEIISAQHRLGVLGVEASVTHIRHVAIGGIVLSAVVVLIAARGLLRCGPTETARIAARFGDRVIPIAAAEKEGDHAVIDVMSMEHLVRLATQYDCLILHQPGHDSDRYLFQVDRTVYRYTAHRETVASATAAHVFGEGAA